MSIRWHTVAVVVLWLATMTWLVVRKVLPPMLIGEPPNYQTILAGEGPVPPVGWNVSLNSQRLGWALNTVTRLPNQTTEVRSRVHFDRVPLDALIPTWLRALVPGGSQPLGHLPIEAESTMLIDPLGRLVEFDSALRAKPLQSMVRLRGSVEGSKLKLSIHSGDISCDPEIPLRSGAMLGDSLAPQMRLPGLRADQSWTLPSYSPLYPLNNPIEILQARVEELEPIAWNGHRERAWRVVYRTDAAAGPGSDKNIRNILWVRPDGTVLRQQVMIFDGVLTFNRMTDREAVELEKAKGGT